VNDASACVKQRSSAFSRNLPTASCFALMKDSTANVLVKLLSVASEVPKQVFSVKEKTDQPDLSVHEK
jgi:hypothetical protein